MLDQVQISPGRYSFKNYIPGVGDLFNKRVVGYMIDWESDSRFNTLVELRDIKALDKEFGGYALFSTSLYYVRGI